MSSNVRVDIEIETELQTSLRKIVRDWPGHSDAMLLAIGEDLVGGLKREVPVNTGTLRQRIGTQETVRQGRVNVTAGRGIDYALPLLNGTRPHAPGSSNPAANRSLARWASRNNYPGGFDSIYWSIARYGTEAHDYLSEPLDRTEANATGVATQVLRNRGVFDL